MTTHSDVSLGKLALWIGLFVVLGIPVTAFLWETLNKVMAGYFDPVRIGLSIPALILFYILLRYMARWVQSTEAERRD